MAEKKKTAGQLAVEAEQARQRLAEVQQQAPGAYQSGYGAQIDALLAKLDSRPGFQYDLQGDALYRQYQQQYQKQGKAAMEDTVGTAAGLTGGYGSSYATTAGSQAYQAYLSKMQDVVPSLYAAAYSRYQDEGSALEKQLEQMKTQESNGFVWYSDHMMSDKIRDRAVLSRFSDALGRGEIQLYLQAQVGAGDRHVIGAEALSRWVCEDGRVIPPAIFIPILEEHGKIWQLDYHIWEMACRLLKSWKDDPVFGSYRISVNISVKDIYYLDLYEVFTHLVEEYKIDPEHLELEITETVFMDKPKEAIALIQRLKEYGFTIAIDDFGSGYSSLSFLKDIQADILKIDMEFLRKTEHQERSRIILRSIVALARELGMPTVVEGVETSQQVRDLTQIGCDIFQGFYYSRPVPVADFEERFPDGLARPWSEPVQAEK